MALEDIIRKIESETEAKIREILTQAKEEGINITARA